EAENDVVETLRALDLQAPQERDPSVIGSGEEVIGAWQQGLEVEVSRLGRVLPRCVPAWFQVWNEPQLCLEPFACGRIDAATMDLRSGLEEYRDLRLLTCDRLDWQGVAVRAATEGEDGEGSASEW